jgi:hypothetical protein
MLSCFWVFIPVSIIVYDKKGVDRGTSNDGCPDCIPAKCIGQDIVGTANWD